MAKDTTSNRARAPRKTARLSIQRLFTTEGVHPYDQVEWEKRDIIQENWKTGDVVFEQRGVTFPKSWSVNASTIVTTKYFRGAVGTPERENSLTQLVDRVVDTYTSAAREHGYITNEDDLEIFDHELKYMLVNQVFSFNSPVWFNVGTSSPQQVSACFILAVDDTMDSILNWYKEEGLIFKGGSGAGLNLSRIRSSKEILRSSGGTASGPVSFMRGADASAGTIKSGGACLAPWTEVFTAAGPRRVDELARTGEDFVTFSYNPVAGRVQAVTGRAFLSGTKRLVRLTTDKGTFTMSADHPVLLMSGGYAQAGDLTPGMSLRPATVTANELGYRRIGLHDGNKGKESLHRLVAMDVLGAAVNGCEVHHKDHDPTNNVPENLDVLSRAEHLRVHAAESFEANSHPFQRFHGQGNHPDVSGQRNGMSHSSGNRTDDYRARQREGMRAAGVYQVGQDAAATQRMMNTAYRIVNNGGSIDTFEEYFQGRLRLSGKMGYSRQGQLSKIEQRFGSFDNFREEVRAGNHRVVSVETLDMSDVYDVEVDSDTPDDRSDRDGHNFMIVSESGREKSWSGIFAHNTRRAAKMVVLDVDHPDIVQFVETKAREEEKIRVLRDAGFDMDLGGEDITSVQYQNANNSVRVSDEFMAAVEDGTDFGLRARTTGDVIDTVDAKSLFRKMAEAAWACADPGIQYDGTINHWHTNPETGRITASNPCSEYMSLDNSSCNLASLNLLKFRLDDGTFDVATFIRAVEFVITAMEISISFADFPTEAIGDTTRNYRQLGIGYANLGALLMASGLGYDSEEGRAYAAAITALMTGVAYRRSAEIAGIVGPYNGYARNADAHTRVMEQHTEQANLLLAAVTGHATERFVADGIVAPYALAVDVAAAAADEWENGLLVGGANGWRNAQASVLAPTGTIGFMMDVDTTGVEPDFSLVKFKKMVGGGSLQIVNQRVADALVTLGYQDETIEAIEEHIAEHGHVVDAPGLKSEHYNVFDCAIGERAISAMGHIRMMAAVQPFLSGAISKTVNLPETATVEEIETVYFDGWKLGLKAIAVYRDNCKVGQPLSDGKKKDTSAGGGAVAEPQVVERIVEKIVEKPARRRLPKKRGAETVSFKVAGAEGYLTVGLYEEGGVGELFVKMSKQGSTLAGIMDAFSIAVSLGLQYGVPLDAFVAKFTNMRFEPSGMTDDPDIRMAQSLLDYMFRRVALDHMPYDERSAYGIYTTAERAEALESGSYGDEETPSQYEIAPPATPLPEVERAHDATASPTLKVEAPMCITCGTASFMVRSGSCWACQACGGTTGCS